MSFGLFIETKNYRFKIETVNIVDWNNSVLNPKVDVCDYPDLHMKRILKNWYLRPFYISFTKKVYY